MVSVSVVSHGQLSLFAKLMEGIATYPTRDTAIRMYLTLNTPEQHAPDQRPDAHELAVLVNSKPRGFAANHNAAFEYCNTKYFCVMNPDVVLTSNPFPALIEQLEKTGAALAAPRVVTSSGEPEDSARYFPTLRSLWKKLLRIDDGSYPIDLNKASQPVDWVAGMFMLFRSDDFRDIGGFDESFFLYYEDVDICARLWKSGRSVIICPEVSIVHDAQRTSRRKLQYMKWHLSSMLRYFRKHWLRLPDIQRATRPRRQS